MDNLNLGSDESILKKNAKIIVSGTRYEGILTTRRLILAERESGTVHEAIPYSEISLAVAGLNSIREPVLRLVIAPSSGEQRSIELIFVYQPGGLNLQDMERSIAILREQKVTIQGSEHLNATGLMSRVNAVSASLQGSDAPTVRQPLPEMAIGGRTYPEKQAPGKEGDAKKFAPLDIAVLIIAILMIVGSLLLVSQALAPKTPQQIQPVVVITPTTPVPSVPAGTPAVIVPDSPTPAISPEPTGVPDNGTWVRISYPGNYTGTIQSGGWNVEVNTTGTSSYLLPVRNGLIKGEIAKSEGTGGKMTVGVYYYGTLISEQDTSKPHGVIDLNLDIQQALAATPTPTPTPAPTVASFSGDLTIPPVTAPASGVWARVFYPGEYVGYFSANGRTKEVNSTGDQFFQLYMSTGSIDGVMEKQDYSSRNMAVQIYKDGVLVTNLNTTAPHGYIDLHTMV
jgi:hypothetical protein